jgi:hypothetical protein
MSKYNTNQEKSPERNKRAHPIWRGIGFIFMILAPILGYAATEVLLSENAKQGWVLIPVELIINGKYPLLLVKGILVLFFIFLFYTIFTLLTFILSDLFAPPQYGPTDVRPLKRKEKRRH